MNPLHDNPPARIERYKTSEGKEFVIARRPRRGRKYQEPQLTGDKLSCPYCSQEHDVVYYLVAKGKKGEKKVRTWICPRVGKLPLNQGRQWDEYIGGIIVKDRSEVEASVHREAQTFEGVTSPEAQPSLTVEMPGETYNAMEQLGFSINQEQKLGVKVTPSPQTTRPLAEFPATALARPVGIGKVRRDLPESWSSAVKRFTDKSPRSHDRLFDRYVASIEQTRRMRKRRSSKHALFPKKLPKFRAR